MKMFLTTSKMMKLYKYRASKQYICISGVLYIIIFKSSYTNFRGIQ
jgi:hypothetical protein